MAKRQTQITVHIYIGAQDQDIADWLNMLSRNGLSRAKWLSALLVAYEQGRTLPIGRIATQTNNPATSDTGSMTDTLQSRAPAPPRKSASDTMMFGTDVSRRNSRDSRRRNGSGTANDLTIKSHLYVCVTNKKAIDVHKKLKENGCNIATVIKYTIRQSLEYGTSEVRPDNLIADQMLATDSFKPLIKGDIRNDPSPNPSSVSQRVERPQADDEIPSQSTSSQAGNGASRTKNPLLDLI